MDRGEAVRRVIIESPYAGDVERNKRYLQACIRDCLARGETPYASHQILTDALDDADPEQRVRGIEAGYGWWDAAEAVVFYVDLGLSDGMRRALGRAVASGKLHLSRSLGPDWEKQR